MGKFPNFSNYDIISELGRNPEGGRITYRATAIKTGGDVVIKEFRFAYVNTKWSGFQAYKDQIDVMRQLSHPRIPPYLDTFDTGLGFCLVQEYKKLDSLATLAKSRNFSVDDIQKIAASVLEILIDLQKRDVIHRDIKPENILVDDQNNAYLVDFGFPRIKQGQLVINSLASGTPGFMPPEEMFNHPLTRASDLYSLGATLICSLARIHSEDIGNLIDENYRLDFKDRVSQINSSFIAWLEKMVSPNLTDRYPNAEVAMQELKESTMPTSKPPTQLMTASGIPTQFIVLGLLALLIGFPLIAAITVLNYQQGNLLQQLRETRSCQKCYLANANLTGVFPKSAGKVLVNMEKANMENAKLENGHLVNANFKGAYLKGAYLKGANLEKANLEKANLENANLENANLEGANLEGANLKGAKLEGARLKDAEIDDITRQLDEKWFLVWQILNPGPEGRDDLKGKDMAGANLLGADLEAVNLEGANLEGANLEGAVLKDAVLKDANLKNANLKNANLKSANLEEANLGSADLDRANLSGAKLRGASFWGANLGGANLHRAIGANLKNAKNLKGAIMDDGTKHE